MTLLGCARASTDLQPLEGEHVTVRAEVAALGAQLRAERAAARTAAEVAERTATERVAPVRALYEERLTELREQLRHDRPTES